MGIHKKQMTVGVFFGSRNPEHEVSIITGQLIISELKKLHYTVVPVYIDKKGRWFSDEKLGTLKFFTGQDTDVELDRLNPCAVECDAQGKKTGHTAKRIDV